MTLDTGSWGGRVYRDAATGYRERVWRTGGGREGRGKVWRTGGEGRGGEVGTQTFC